MTYDRTDRFRRAAILIASLDEPLADQLLSELPPVEAARVLAEAEALDALDPEEQADVLAEFRRLSRGRVTAATSSAVEFEYSGRNDASHEQVRAADFAPAIEPAASAKSLSDADAAGMAELLADEHPQIVAAALSRLSDEQGAAVFAALPEDLQAQTLQRLAALAPADEEAVLAVESQLQHRLQQRREHQARSAAGAELVQKILSRTPAAQRTVLLERMAARDAAPTSSEPAAPRVVGRGAESSRAGAIDPVAQQALNLASAVRRAQAAGAYQAPPEASDHTEELEALSDEALVASLRAADEPTVLRALAASGETFLRRVTNMLPRKQAKQLRRMLRDLGPTRLADLHEAQQRLLELAYESMVAEAA